MIRNYWKPILWSIVVIVFCLVPANNIPHPRGWNVPHLDKIVHFLFYFILAILLRGAGDKNNMKKIRSVLISLVVVITMGGTIEVLQELYFHRSGDWYDMLANCCGGIAGLVFYRYLPSSVQRFL